MKENAALRALPRVAFTPEAPSEYRIRREPKDEYVSTIEALTHVLGLLEGDAERFALLLVPFRKMVDVQIDYVTRVHAGRVRKQRNKVRKHSVLPEAFRAHPDNHIYIVAESNAWPFGSKEREAPPNGELVHVVAWRNGERFEHFVDPKLMHEGALARCVYWPISFRRGDSLICDETRAFHPDCGAEEAYYGRRTWRRTAPGRGSRPTQYHSRSQTRRRSQQRQGRRR